MVNFMRGVRGAERSPGEFRTSQNWIGASGCTLTTAAFVPPPPHEVMNALGALERFIHDSRETMPLLVRCGLAHAQFETIHPFLDGNGRVGRLLITLMLCEDGALIRPLLYLSLYLKAHRAEYYDRLMAIRQSGKWEEWLKFFLRGVSQTARLATDTARSIVELRESLRQKFARNAKALLLLDALFTQPYVSVNRVKDIVSSTFPTASRLVAAYGAAGVLTEVTGGDRNRLYRFEPYIEILRRDSAE